MKRMSAPPAPALTADEQRILADFRMMDQRAKDEMRNEMARRARAHPERRPATLRLVGGGAR
jgi:hypothetical protein